MLISVESPTPLYVNVWDWLLQGVHENVVDYTAIVAFGLTASWSIGSTSNSYVVSAASPVCGSAAAAAVIENLIVPLSVVDMEDPVSESSVETLSTASTHIAERPQESKSFYVEVYLGVPPKPVRLELNLRERGLAVLPSAFPYQQSSVNSPVSASSPLCLSGKPAPSNSNYCFSEADDQSSGHVPLLWCPPQLVVSFSFLGEISASDWECLCFVVLLFLLLLPTDSWSGVQYRDAISFGGPSIMSNLTIVSLPSDTPSPFHHSSVGVYVVPISWLKPVCAWNGRLPHTCAPNNKFLVPLFLLKQARWVWLPPPKASP